MSDVAIVDEDPGGAEGGVWPMARRRRAYAASALATVMSVIDGSIANTALPTIGRDLHASVSATVWVINAFSLAVTAGLFGAAALAQSYGVTRSYRIGILVFTGGSLLCALSSTLPMLIVARVLQGIGAAIVMAISPSILRRIFPSNQLGRALGLNAMWTAVAAAAGPATGGILLAIAPWQVLFAINVPITVLVFYFAHNSLPDIPGTREKIDIPSLLTSALGFSAIVYGLDGIARHEAPAIIALETIFGLAVFAWFARRQFVMHPPTIALDLFRVPRFAFAANASFSAWTAWMIGLVALPFLLQLGYGLTPLASGLALTPWPIATALVAATAGRFADRYSVARVAVIGMVIFLCGLLALVWATLVHASPLIIGAFSAICGGGYGIFQAPNNREIMGAGPIEKDGSASALLATIRVGAQTAGGAIVAIVFSLTAAHLSTLAPADAVEHAVPIAFAVAAGFAAIAVAISGQRIAREAGA